MENDNSSYPDRKKEKNYFLEIGFLFALVVMFLLLDLMYLISDHDDFSVIAFEMQMPLEVGKVQDLMQMKLQQVQVSPPEGNTPPKISLVDEIASKVVANSEPTKENTNKPSKDSVDTKLPGSGVGSKGEADVEDPMPFSIIEDDPVYPGGLYGLHKFLLDNTKYPVRAKDAGILGTVVMSFIVEKDGSVTNVKVVRGLGGGCSEEAIRVISKMAKWTPGKQHDKVVRVVCQIQIIFGLKPI